VEPGVYIINKGNFNDWTPLFYTCEKGHKNKLKYLLEVKASINKKRKQR